jgi:hypothetical protein
VVERRVFRLKNERFDVRASIADESAAHVLDGDAGRLLHTELRSQRPGLQRCVQLERESVQTELSECWVTKGRRTQSPSTSASHNKPAGSNAYALMR